MTISGYRRRATAGNCGGISETGLAIFGVLRRLAAFAPAYLTTRLGAGDAGRHDSAAGGRDPCGGRSKSGR